MCKNTSQPGFDPTLKRPGKGHRLCNPFRTTRFFYPNSFDPNPHGSNPNPIDPTRCQVYLILKLYVKTQLLLY